MKIATSNVQKENEYRDLKQINLKSFDLATFKAVISSYNFHSSPMRPWSWRVGFGGTKALPTQRNKLA